jgi:hypothetical protein
MKLKAMEENWRKPGVISHTLGDLVHVNKTMHITFCAKALQYLHTRVRNSLTSYRYLDVTFQISIFCHFQSATWMSAIRGSYMCQKNTNNLCKVGYIQGNINNFKT